MWAGGDEVEDGGGDEDGGRVDDGSRCGLGGLGAGLEGCRVRCELAVLRLSESCEVGGDVLLLARRRVVTSVEPRPLEREPAFTGAMSSVLSVKTPAAARASPALSHYSLSLSSLAHSLSALCGSSEGRSSSFAQYQLKQSTLLLASPPSDPPPPPRPLRAPSAAPRRTCETRSSAARSAR